MLVGLPQRVGRDYNHHEDEALAGIADLSPVSGLPLASQVLLDFPYLAQSSGAALGVEFGLTVS